LFDPLTRQLFRDAGIAPVMRVLDVGSASGDVAFLAARMVGPEGGGIGTDKSRGAFESLANRIRDEVVAGGGVIVTPPLVGAWSRQL
jgi:ubiquinone/menaquinone biosynthesis C-methylase UbiE